MSTVSSFCRMAVFGFCLASSGFATAQPLNPSSFSSLGVLDLSGGNFTIDTDALTIVDDAAPGTPLFTGVSDDQNGTADFLGPRLAASPRLPSSRLTTSICSRLLTLR